eukprot:1247504-Prymnesium_polylepis.1
MHPDPCPEHSFTSGAAVLTIHMRPDGCGVSRFRPTHPCTVSRPRISCAARRAADGASDVTEH